MCGRFTITDPEDAIRRLFGYDGPPLGLIPRYNVAPTQIVPVVRVSEAGKRGIAMLRWGLVPGWAKDLGAGAKMINARADTVAEKPAFRAAYKARRCLIPADGFYEWQEVPGAPSKAKKQPYRILRQEAAPFAFAGLWERWRDPAGAADTPAIETFTIITTDAAPSIAAIHHRMPVMLTRPEQFAVWLGTAAGDPAALLAPYDGNDLTTVAVSTKVNNARHDAPDCLDPAPPAAP